MLARVDHRSWSRLARRQSGVISRAQLQRIGVERGALESMINRGLLIKVAHAVYRSAAVPFQPDTPLWVAVLTTNGVLHGSAAAFVWNMVSEPPQLIDVVVEPSRRLRPPDGIRVRRLGVPPAAITTRLGLPVTVRSRTALDHLAGQSFVEAMTFADRALAQGWLTVDHFERRLTRSKSTGNAMIRRVLKTIVTGAEAESERRLHRLLRQAGLGGWVGNHPVLDHGRLVGRVDVAFPELKLAIEVDGFAYHSDHVRFQRDRTKQNDLVSLGWTILRFTWADLVERPEYVVAVIRRHTMNGVSYSA